MKQQLVLTALAMTLMGGVHADPVLDWNAIAAQTILAPGARPGPSVVLDFAVVHTAVHDAVQAYDKQFEPYAIDIQNAGGSVAAAVAKATHDVLVNRFPAQAPVLDTVYDNYLSDHGLDQSDPGVVVGEQAADAIILLRANDGSFPAVFPPFIGAELTGVWRPTPSYLPGPPPSFSPMVISWMPDVTPFVVESASQFRAEPPPQLNSDRYRQDYDEVKAVGGLNSTARTSEQTQLAYFYADNFFAQWNRTVRGFAETYLDTGEAARFLALAWMAVADSVITTWDCKIHYAFWRPVTAIQEGENDGNFNTAGDPTWQPFLNTPNYPEYSSGANAVVASITRTARLFLGTDKLPITVTSNHPLASPGLRTYERLSDIEEDMVNVRIYHGLHFRFGDEAGRKTGQQVARWVFHHALRPLHADSCVANGHDN